MRRLFLILILMLAPVGLAAQEAEPTKAQQLILEDSQNAHEMATVALEAMRCLLSDAPQQVCMMQFEPRYLSLGRQHLLIHKQLRELAKRKRS